MPEHAHFSPSIVLASLSEKAPRQTSPHDEVHEIHFRIPCLHKASGQARTIVNGRHVNLGKFGSPESRQKYARILAEAALPAGTPDSPNRPKSRNLLVFEMLVAYLKFAESYYSSDGQTTKEFRGMVDAVGPLNELYGDTLADD